MAPTFVIPHEPRGEVGKEKPPYDFIMYNLETLFANLVDRALGNSI